VEFEYQSFTIQIHKDGDHILEDLDAHLRTLNEEGWDLVSQGNLHSDDPTVGYIVYNVKRVRRP